MAATAGHATLPRSPRAHRARRRRPRLGDRARRPAARPPPPPALRPHRRRRPRSRPPRRLIALTDAPPPTAVPGGETVSPGPPATHKPTTTVTDWGVILDAVPDDFPRYPGAKDTEADEPVSAALIAEAAADEVAKWYRDALEAAGYATIDLSDPLEDGSRSLDSQTDLPECKVQTTVRPEGGSTMITVLFAAGCVAIGG